MKKSWFINPQEKRLRAGWRLALFLVAVPVIMQLITMVIVPLFGSYNDINAVKWFSRGVLVVAGIGIAVFITRKLIDRRSVTSLGLRINRNTWRDMLAGFFLSGLMAAAFFFILLATGQLQVDEISWQTSELTPLVEILLLFFGVGIATGLSEELAFRGYILQNLGEGIGLKWSILILCVLYGAVHMANPNSTLLSGTIIIAFGFIRIFGWLRTGQLWLSIGMHAGWNFFQGPVFGFSASGTTSNHLIKHSLNGPGWLTGGEFGPEGSVIVIPVLVLAIAAMYWLSRKRRDTPWLQLTGKPTAQRGRLTQKAGRIVSGSTELGV